MIRTPEHQHWVLLGTAPASEEIWGLRQIDFPCGYHIPPGAFAPSGTPLERPKRNGEVWAMGGFAMEISQGGKAIRAEDAPEHVAGCRPWVCVFHDALLDELHGRTHTIEMWDRGVSIFYGLWREATHALGDLIPCVDLAAMVDRPTHLKTGVGAAEGSPASAYAYDAEAIITFMSQFMTLSAGDIYIQGPLVARRLGPDEHNVTFGVDGLELEVEVD